MSGPKSYSVEVFDADLKKIFKAQCSIQLAVDELSRCRICDVDRNIHIDCGSFLDSKRDHIRRLLSPFTVKHKGTISQSIYDNYRQLLREKLSQLESFANVLKEERSNFATREEDYQAFVSYETYFEQRIKGFEEYKNQVAQYLISYVQQEYPDYCEQAQARIVKTNLRVDKPPFQFGFRKTKDEMIAIIDNQTDHCRSIIDNIRSELSDKVAEDIQSGITEAAPLAKCSNKGDEKIEKKIEKIRQFVSCVEDPVRCQDYQDRLKALMNSKYLKDEYYYTELLEDIREAEKQYKWKADIHKAVTRLDQFEIHETMKSAKADLTGLAVELIGKNKIKRNEYDELRARLQMFNQKNNKAIQEAIVREKEQQFIKAQLAQSLQALNYEVMDDMEVIDFEKGSDFLFKIPEQKNFLNLRFRENGSLLYNFVIPESKTELSIDQKQVKLGEMETACSEFKALLKELTSMGLKIDLEAEIPVSEKALIQVPNKYQPVVGHKRSGDASEPADQQRYLTR